jgi:type I site-specific restriction endonuclease
MNLFDPSKPGVAVREAHLKTGFADYLLFVEGKALGVVEAKKVGVPLSGVEAQSARYERWPRWPTGWRGCSIG